MIQCPLFSEKQCFSCYTIAIKHYTVPWMSTIRNKGLKSTLKYTKVKYRIRNTWQVFLGRQHCPLLYQGIIWGRFKHVENWILPNSVCKLKVTHIMKTKTEANVVNPLTESSFVEPELKTDVQARITHSCHSWSPWTQMTLVVIPNKLHIPLILE